MFATVILGAGAAGTGPLVWAARHGLLNEWLDTGIAVVERHRSITGSIGQYALNADTLADTFLECLEGSCCEQPIVALRADPVTRELAAWRGKLPPLELVGRFLEVLGSLLTAQLDSHPTSVFLPGCTAEAVRLEANGCVTALTVQDGVPRTIEAASAVMALGGVQDRSWDRIEMLPGLTLRRWRHKLVASDQLLTRGGAALAHSRLARSGRQPLAVILGGSHSAFSSAWVLLNLVPNVQFGAAGVQILHRGRPKVFFPSREAALQEGYRFGEDDVCPATGRVFRLSGLRGDGRETCRRMLGLAGLERERRAIARPLHEMRPEEIEQLLDAADLIVPALGYRLTRVQVFAADGNPIPLAETGPAVDSNSRLLTADGRALDNVFGVGLGSDFQPWGPMAGERSFRGQQNSLWLFQNGVGQSIYHNVRSYAAQLANMPQHRLDPTLTAVRVSHDT